MIEYFEKPDWISWEEIRSFLFEAHAANREKGIVMSHYQWPAEKIKESLGENGMMLVAVDGHKLVGTAAIAEKYGSCWYAKGRYAYECYAGVLPDYAGRGIFKHLEIKREELARTQGYKILVGDTHAKNKHRQEIALKNGFRTVRFFRAKSNDHYSVVYVKWLDQCPYSAFYCNYKYQTSKAKAIIRTKLSSSISFIKRK